MKENASLEYSKSKWTIVRIFRTFFLVLCWIIVVPITLLVLGAHANFIPYLGTIGTTIASVISWVLVLSLLIGLLVGWFWIQNRNRASLILSIMALLSCVGCLIISGRMIATANDNGAHINLFQTLKPAVSTDISEETVVYSSYDNEPLKLEIYRPLTGNSNEQHPVLMYVHGGGWIMGSRLDHQSDMRWFAEQGWLVISVDYTLSTKERNLWDITEGQIACAMTWAGQNAKNYGGDISRFAMIGDSAGGNLVLNTSYQANQGTLKSASGGEVPKVVAVSTIYPVVDPSSFYNNPNELFGSAGRNMIESYIGGAPNQYPERYKAIQSDTHITPYAPPTFILVGERDHLVPPKATYDFTEKVRKAGVDIKQVIMPYSDHGFDLIHGSIGSQTFLQLSQQWFKQHGL
ncbi:alpha/beta hydrolase [Paenibacillus motobuensis]|uniref:BD-FAE-like domain-containing protein n=1 Tax=Paenibacillus motobuensis TaxID=295324 RepID=A0ABN0YLM1_9BACL